MFFIIYLFLYSSLFLISILFLSLSSFFFYSSLTSCLCFDSSPFSVYTLIPLFSPSPSLSPSSSFHFFTLLELLQDYLFSPFRVLPPSLCFLSVSLLLPSSFFFPNFSEIIFLFRSIAFFTSLSSSISLFSFYHYHLSLPFSFFFLNFFKTVFSFFSFIIPLSSFPIIFLYYPLLISSHSLFFLNFSIIMLSFTSSLYFFLFFSFIFLFPSTSIFIPLSYSFFSNFIEVLFSLFVFPASLYPFLLSFLLSSPSHLSLYFILPSSLFFVLS